MVMVERKNLGIHFRISEIEYDLLFDEAKKRKLTMGKTARIVLLESLSGYDEKQEYFLRRLDKQDEDIEMLIQIASLAVAAGSLPLNQEQYDINALREIIKKHLFDSSALGKNILDMIKKGKI
jgi:hypothetical protein